MNSRQYFLSQMQPGDVIALSGHALISYLIDAFTGPVWPWQSESCLSHLAIVERPFDGTDVWITESTIYKGKNGPQSRSLSDLLLEYSDDKDQAWWLQLNPKLRAYGDWAAFQSAVTEAEAQDKYDIPGLFAFLVRNIPVIGSRFCQTESAKRLFCSGYAVWLLESSQILRGINYSKEAPQDVVEMGIWCQYQQIFGPPGGTLARFATIG